MSEDIFGQLLWDYFNGKNVFEMIKRDDGFISATPIKRYFVGFSDWSVSEKKAIRYVKGEVLDIGCGAGRHSLFLQHNNHDAVGIDNSPLALKVSKARGVSKTKKLDLNQINKLEKSFDTHILLGNNLGLLGNSKEVINFLETLYKKTNEGGLALLGNRNPYLTKKEIHKRYLEKNEKNNSFPGKIKIKLRYKELESEWFFFLLLSPKEALKLIEETPWNPLKVLGEEKKDYVILINKK